MKGDNGYFRFGHSRIKGQSNRSCKPKFDVRKFPVNLDPQCLKNSGGKMYSAFLLVRRSNFGNALHKIAYGSKRPVLLCFFNVPRYRTSIALFAIFPKNFGK